MDFTRPKYQDYKMYYEPVSDGSIGIFIDV